MKKNILLVLSILVCSIANSQTWYFGDKGGIKFTKNFSGTWSVTPSGSSPLLSKVNTNEGCAVTNDASGNVLLYTDGTYVWDAQGNKIKTSQNTDIKLNGFSSATQSGLIVPVPSSNCFEKYFVFGVPHIGTYGDQNVSYEPCAPDKGISYTVVTKNSSGWVASPVQTITQDASRRPITAVTEKITAVGDGNKGYWVLFHGFYNYSSGNIQSTCLTSPLADNSIGKRFFAVHIKSTNTGTVPAPIPSDVAPMISREREHTSFWSNGAQGQLKFSRDGTKVAMVTSSAHEIYVYAFNKTTGKITSAKTIQDNFTGTSNTDNGLSREYGVEFSPSGKYLYVSKEHESNSKKGIICRFDLSNVSPLEELITSSTSTRYGALQLGPDNNIYVAYSELPRLSIIGKISNTEDATLTNVTVAPILIAGSSIAGLPTLIQNEMICGVEIVDGSSTICGCPNVTNLITNGNFENGATGLKSKFTQMTNLLVPGTYTVAEYASYKNFCSNWNISNPASCPRTGVMQGKFLVVNGQTGQTGFKTAWDQTITVETGKDYKICMNLKNLPQCCFDVKPVIRIMYNYGSQSNFIGPITVNQANTDCDWLKYTTTISIPASGSPTTLLSINIDLDQSGLGDGNDIAIDDVSLIKLNKLPAGSLRIAPNDVSTTFINNTDYTMNVPVTANPPLPAGSGIWWRVVELDPNNNEIPGTVVENPNSSWWTIPCKFPGYNGTSTVSGTSPGIFKTDKTYKIHFGTWGECFSWTSANFTISINPSSRKAIVTQDNKPISSPKNIQ